MDFLKKLFKPQAQSLMSLEDVSYSVDGLPLIQEVSLEVTRGETLAIMGPDGCGKSTLLKLMAGLLPPDRGRVIQFGEDITGRQLEDERVRQIRRRIGYVFQSGALISNMSVFENVALPLRYHLSLPREELEAKVHDKLDLVGMRAQERMLPASLSAGQQKRVALARSLILDPALLFLDDPSAGMDPVHTDEIARTIRLASQRANASAVLASHDVGLVRKMADRVIFFWGGRVAENLEAFRFFESPNPLVVQFIAGSSEGPLSTSERTP